ncbi:unnamed protein product [Peronospora destructor]|uniref:Cation/H+ exchanger transmembrane domain-containing protein n=1 Tax=Peronospora destructor TaxID=86335 RepID=A0AAV0TN03_9STRA|nr:unnamed protein product [Peronospora destructor]
MLQQTTNICKRHLLRAPSSTTVLLLALTLIVANSLPATSGESVVREEIDINEVHTRRLSGGGGNKNKTVMFNSWSNTIDTLQYVLAFVIVLVAAHPLGLFFPKLFRLPLITGYLFIGIFAGPFVSNLLSADLVAMLSSYVSALALSFISFQAGQEIYLPELRPQLKPIMMLLGVLYVTAMVIVSSAAIVTESMFFYDDMGISCQLGIALMFGSISVLGSPATVMAIKIELDSVGPFTSLMLGATMMAEFIVLISFSAARIVCSIYCAKLDVTMLNLMFTMSIVASNFLVGVLLGGVIILIFKISGGKGHHDDHGGHGAEYGVDASYFNQTTTQKSDAANLDMDPHHHDKTYDCSIDEPQHAPAGGLSPEGALSLKGFLWLLMGYIFYISSSLLAELTAAAFGLSWEIKFEALLVLMIASCIAGHNTAIRHDMHVILDTDRAYNNLWLTMTPQAGVALGLANEVKALSDETWANDFAATIVAAVVVNQIIGPVLCAMGLSRAGETLKDRAPDHQDTNR